MDPTFTFSFDEEGVPMPVVKSVNHNDSHPKTKSKRKKKRNNKRGTKVPVLSDFERVNSRKNSLLPRQSSSFGGRLMSKVEKVISRSHSSRLTRVTKLLPKPKSRFSNTRRTGITEDKNIGRHGSLSLFEIDDVASVSSSHQDQARSDSPSNATRLPFLSEDNYSPEEREFVHENESFRGVVNSTEESENTSQLKRAKNSKAKETDFDVLLNFYKQVRPEREDSESRCKKLLEKYPIGNIALALERKYGKHPEQWEEEYQKVVENLESVSSHP